LLCWRIGVIHVITRGDNRRGENMNMIAEKTGSDAPATGEKPRTTKPKTTKKVRVAPQDAHAVHKKPKSAQKANSAKRAPQGAKKAKGAPEGNKTTQILDLLKQPGGITAQELSRFTGWQPHSVRGFLSGTVGKKMGLTVTSTKGDDGERNYSVKA
jgi:hypothetical protein